MPEMSDIAAVMSAVGSDRATIVGFGAGGPLTILFAATHPEVVTALVLINAWTRLRRDDDHPFGLPAELEAPLLEMGGADHPYWAGDVGALTGEIERFLTGSTRPVPADRTLATVLFTDLVNSTAQLERQGDSSWRAVLDRHDRTVRHQIERFGGQVVKTTGDGIVALFDAPSRAVRCACAIRDAVGALDLSVRVGIHTGEIEYQEHDIAGIAVHIAARLVALAAPGEILASSTVHDLTAGAPLRFNERGTHTLKGVSTPWQLFTVES